MADLYKTVRRCFVCSRLLDTRKHSKDRTCGIFWRHVELQRLISVCHDCSEKHRRQQHINREMHFSMHKPTMLQEALEKCEANVRAHEEPMQPEPLGRYIA